MKTRRTTVSSQTLQRHAIIIQRNWRRYQAHKQYLQRLRKMKKKSYTILELLNSERSYCEHIAFVIRDIMEPSKSLIGDDQLHNLLFSNIKEIYELHRSFLEQLETVMQNYDGHLTRLSRPLLQGLIQREQFRNAYIVYCQNYRKADQVIRLLVGNNSGFTQHLRKLGITSSSLSLDSYLIKPVQRLCQYKLLLRQYLKCMEQDHLDYQSIEMFIGAVENLVVETNQQVEEFLMRQRYREIRSSHMAVFAKLPEEKRKLLFETDGPTLVNMNKEQQTIYKSLLFFSDGLLLLPRSGQEPSFIDYTVVRELPNFKYYRNMIQVVDQEKYYVLQLRDDAAKKDFLDVLVRKTDYLSREKSVKFISVQILGTETRQSFFSSYTVYIVVRESNGKAQKFYPRFKDILKIQDYLQRIGVKLNVHRLFKESCYSTRKSRTIERRKLHIQEFLERIFNYRQTINLPFVEELLGSKQETCSQDEEEISILLPNLQRMKIQVSSDCARVADIKRIVAENLSLQNSSQFELFEVRNKNYLTKRLIYDDEPASKISQEQKTASSSINPFRDCLEYLYTRHYYLSDEEQLAAYDCDPVRGELQLAVIHSQMHQYRLSEDVLNALLCLLAMYIQLPMHDGDKVMGFLKEAGKKATRMNELEFQMTYSQISSLLAKECSLFSIPLVAIRVVTANTSLYQCQQFEVEIPSKIYADLRKHIKGLEDKLILALKRRSALLLSLKDRSVLREISYFQLGVAQTHPSAIVLEINDLPHSLRLKTLQVYEISRLIEIYKAVQ